MNIFATKKIVYYAFLSIFFIGLYISKDFGVSWDENIHRKMGKENLAYILRFLNLDNILNVPKHIEDPSIGVGGYGPVFDILCLFSEKILSIEDSKKIFLLRHKINFIVYFVGVFVFYFFVSRVYKNRFFGFAGALFYLFSPRLFANGFYNPKDSISQALLACSLLPIYLAYKNKDLKMSILAGIIVGISITVRLPILYFPCLFILLIAYKSFKNGQLLKIEDKLKAIGMLFAVSTTISVIFFFPVLWEAPYKNFLNIFSNLSKYPWEGNNLFMKELINASNPPWYYVPVWILVTTPLSFIICLITGIFKLTKDIFIPENQDNLFSIFMLSGLIVPILSVIILESTLYNGWRHLYFVYPFMAFFMTYGFQFIWKKICSFYPNGREKVLILLTLFIFINPLFFIYNTHPNQQVYFNKLAGSYPLSNFEGDYYAVSMYQALDWIIKNDERYKITVSSPFNVAAKSNLLLDPKDRKRLDYIATKPKSFLEAVGKNSFHQSIYEDNDKTINYLITNSRLEMEGFSEEIKNEVFSVRSGSLKLWSIYTVDSK